MTIIEMAKIIEAEASVLPYEGKLGTAQCIIDNNYNAAAFAKPVDYEPSADSIRAAQEAENGVRRVPDAEILKLRSFTNYSDGNGNPDWVKLKSGPDPLPDDMLYLGCDYLDMKWGSMYFGYKKEAGNMFKMLVMAGHGTNVDGSYDPGAVGCGYKEAELNRELVKLIKATADKRGISCDVAPDRNNYSFLKNGGMMDFTPYKYVLEVHFNASSVTDYKGDGKLKGSMFYISQSEKGHSVEDKILANLYALGSTQAWDGVVVAQRQWPNGLLVQERVRAQGVSHGLLETCFISDLDDVTWYQGNKAKIAEAIMSGIISGFNLEPTPVPETIYRVQIGAFKMKSYADAQCKKAQAAGFADTYAALGTDGIYRVQIGAFTIKEYADAMCKDAKIKGFKNAYVTTK